MENAIQSLDERAITSFSLEEAKAEIRQIQYRSNSTNKHLAVIAAVAVLASALIAVVATTIYRKHAQPTANQTPQTYKRYSKDFEHVSMISYV